MYEIALVNPRTKKTARKNSTPKRQGAKVAKRRRKMTAKQLKYFGPRRKRKRASASRRRRRSPARTVVVATNPRRHRRRRRSNPRYKARSRRRSNPRMFGGTMGNVIGTLMPAGIGAAGVLAVDRLLSMVPIAPKISADPAMQKHINRAARLVAVAGVGIAARKFLGGEQGGKIAVAAMGIAVHGLLASFIGASVPGLSGDLDGDDMMGAYLNGDLDGDDVGAYISGDMDGMTNAPLIEGDNDIAPLISGDDFGADEMMGEYISGDYDS